MYQINLSVCWKLDNYNILYANQDILYNCPLNSMCRCFPNDTKLLEINCNEVTLYKFPEFLHGTIRHIEMSHTLIQNVDDETFQGLRLESLKLVNNKLIEFSEKSFSFMTHSLISLDISGNLFQSVPLESIKSIHTLSRLIAQRKASIILSIHSLSSSHFTFFSIFYSIHRNFIQHLDGNWGNLADSLRSLHLSENSISEITFNHDEKKHNYSTSALSSLPALIQMHHPIVPESSTTGKQQPYKTFSKLKKLVWLDLSSNRIQHIGSNTLPKTLVTLDLSRNLLSMFPTNMLEHLHDLRILSLRDNLLTKLNDINFQTFKTHLEKIDLSQNNIDELPGHLFNSTTPIKAINFDKNFITYVPSEAFRNMNIVHLVLSYNHLKDIDLNAFATLEESLEYLDLERNFLTTIPMAIYNLNKLRYLYFTSNAISSVDMLPATLKVLSLSSNNFSRIPVEVLINCTELSYLNMGYNKLTNIDSNSFVGWGSEIQTLLLRNNKISDLEYGAFNGLDSIKEISLSFNDIHNIHPLVFENVSKSLKILELSFSIYSEDYPQEAISYLNELMWLGLDNNNLKLIPDDSLSTLFELTYINLSFNRLTLIPQQLFLVDIHRNLLEIDLSYNAIEKITSQTFNGLELLQLINLSSNKIKSIEKSSFHHLPYLTYIDLTYNQLRNLSENAFEFLPNLLSIELMFNNLFTFSLKCFKHVSNTSTPMSINISNNAIHHFDGELSTYLYIHSLDASNNQLSEPQAFKNIGYSLRVLYLNGNNLSLLGNHAFGDLPLLEILNLAFNNITSLRRRSFQGLSNLQELDLSYNKIESLQVEQFFNLKKLRYLKLNNNNIRSLPRDVFLNTRIEYLDLSNNYISIWPVNSFSDVGFTLRSVRINANQLEYLDSTMFMNTQYLTELNLSYNQLKILPDNTFSTLNNLTSLDLSFNPLITANFRELLLNVPQLRFLNLKSTGLYSVPTMYLTYLIELDLSKNQIQDVDSLLDLKYLRKLSLSDNKIFNITTLARNLPPSLRSLDISRNPIRKISLHDFTPIRRLEEMAIEDVKISNTDAFIKLHSLKVLRICSQHNLSDIISKMRGLRELYITVYDHRLDGKYFGKMLSNTKLNLIDISGHKLRSISSNAFHGLARNLYLKIRIRKTMISDLPTNLFYALKHIPKLSIDLIDNKLSRFSPDIFYPNTSAWDAVGTRSIMGGISTMGNTLPCDCDHVWYGHWLRRWLRETAQVNVVTKDEAKRMLKRARQSTCIDLMSGKRISFLEIFPEDLLCHASALSSLGLTLKFKYLLLYLSAVAFFSWRTFL
ncbi:CLUMA_CG015766, isoform A [Clunio marinus]|uniref:CLUMA_CG015766, isoform A n=1 Tax=Clunio marinus TaxID=568069 RepID=A0A1J1IQY4_9DIPT|nr:CLUMA_CG015766, isoform A [Clunio marinus]